MEQEIRLAIEKALNEIGIEPVDFVVEHPADSSHGDYATNVALLIAKNAGTSPRECAEKIVEQLDGTILNVAEITIAGPGFINFHLHRDFFKEKITEVLSQGDDWGKNDLLIGEEILFEYTSPNLFKPLHIGNLVGNIIGESISRLLENGGATVRRLNFPSDIGPVVAKSVWGIMKLKGDPTDIKQIGEAYKVGNEAYETDPKAKEEIEQINRSLYAEDNAELEAIRTAGIKTSRTHLAQLCAKLGTIFDVDIPESEAGPVGAELVKQNIGKVFEISDGATVFRGEQYGLHTRVFLNSQNLPTYEAKDLGNFALKQERYPNWTQSIIVTGSEQREYFKVLFSALKEVFPKSNKKPMRHIPTGFLTLATGKMSSRKGNVLTGEDILEEVAEVAHAKAQESRAPDIDALADTLAVSAIKYQILRQSVGSDIVFDKERALSLEGDSGPYLEYTHARIFSLLNKAHAISLSPSTSVSPEQVYEIERILYQFTEVVLKSQKEYAPHYLVTYLTALSGAFNSFYAQEKIVEAEDAYAPYKLALAQAVGQTIRNGLYLLGIRAVERM